MIFKPQSFAVVLFDLNMNAWESEELKQGFQNWGRDPPKGSRNDL